MKTEAKLLVEKTNTGYSAYCEALGILATGSTLEAAQQDAQDGLADQCDHLGETPEDYELAFTEVNDG